MVAAGAEVFHDLQGLLFRYASFGCAAGGRDSVAMLAAARAAVDRRSWHASPSRCFAPHMVGVVMCMVLSAGGWMLTSIIAGVEDAVEKSDAVSTWYVEPLNAVAAAFIGTVVTLLVNAWWRYRNRAQPEWNLNLRAVGFPRGGSAHGDSEGYGLYGSLSNIGDGVAHGVKVRAEPKASFSFSDKAGSGGVAPLMLPGSSESLGGSVPLGHWDDAILIIEWTVSPTHRKKRESLKVRLSEQLDRPGFEYTDPTTGEVSQKYFEDG